MPLYWHIIKTNRIYKTDNAKSEVSDMDDRSARNLPNLKSSREVFIKPLPPNERGRHKVAYTVAAVILALVLLALILLPALFPKGFHSVDYEPGPDANATAQVAFFYAHHKEIRSWSHYHLKTKRQKTNAAYTYTVNKADLVVPRGIISRPNPFPKIDCLISFDRRQIHKPGEFSLCSVTQRI